MTWKDAADFIATVGFPGFVALFVLIRLEPAIRKLRQSITSLMVVTARSNGMKGEDVADIVRVVSQSSGRRRVADQIDGVVQSAKKK